MKLKTVLEYDAIAPTRAYATDAGLDLYARDDGTVYPYSQTLFDTGVHVMIPEGYVGFLKSKSGLNTKHGITSEGVIDAGYNGTIVVSLHNDTCNAYRVKKGDKITQLVILPIVTPEIEICDTLDDTPRGTGGFGSTGR